MVETIIASEAVFGFAAWLTGRNETVTVGAAHEAGKMAELAEQWCKTNNLVNPREGIYPFNIKQPTGGEQT